MSDYAKTLGQWMTPFWAAEELVARYFDDLRGHDAVIEPSCGTGAFLRAVPRHIPALGVEIDPSLADQARQNSGRQVVTGDFRTVALSLQPTAIIGNPPFNMEVFDGMLKRAFSLLPIGGAAGFILPAYAFQTPSRTLGYAERWSLRADLLPRSLFPRLTTPLVFAMFRKDLQRTMVGFALYQEQHDIERMPAAYQQVLKAGRGGLWREVVATALLNLGGEASLDSIYRAVEGRRPTGNRWWKEKVRQTLQSGFIRRADGRWSLPMEAAA